VIIQHEVGVPGLRRALILSLFLLPATLTWLSCGSSSPSTGTRTSGLKYRAFVSDSVSAGTSSAGVYIVNAQTDVHPLVSPIAAGNTPGMMLVTPNRALTIVFSGTGTATSDNQLTFIDNVNETSSTHLTLPGMTESIAVSPDSSTGYVAVPTAPVVGQPPGAVDVVSLTNGNITGEVDVPAVHYLSIGNTGTRLLAFSDNSDSVTVITPSNIGLTGSVVSVPVTGFNRPVAAFFSSDDKTAYVLNCGPECGGTQASIQTLDLTTNTAGPPGVVCTTGGSPSCIGTLDIAAGSVAFVNGSTMYVAGTPLSAQPCTGQTTAAAKCGLLSIVDLSSMTVTNSGIAITDGYHNRIALGANGQLFIGARACTEIVGSISPPTGEVRGCLSIYNTLSTAVGGASPGGVVIPPETGDVTGIQPISTRNVVYVVQGQNVQGGTLYIYDTTIDALEFNPNNSGTPGQVAGLVGDFVDVKTVDF
jgi:hypothetical protein